jgi:hypothetical protein
MTGAVPGGVPVGAGGSTAAGGGAVVDFRLFEQFAMIIVRTRQPARMYTLKLRLLEGIFLSGRNHSEKE